MDKFFRKMWVRLLSFTLVGAISCLLPIGVGFAEDDASEVEANAYEFVNVSGLSAAEQQILAAIEAEEAELVAAIVREGGGIDLGGDLEDMEDGLHDLAKYVSEEELKILSELDFDSLATDLAPGIEEGIENGEEFIGIIKAAIARLVTGKKLSTIAIDKLEPIIRYLVKKKGIKGLKFVKKFLKWIKYIKSVPNIFDKWINKTKKFPWQSGWKPWRGSILKPSIMPSTSWIRDRVSGSNVRILTTARLHYIGGDDPSRERVRISAPRHIHLKASRPGYHKTRNLPVTVTNNTNNSVKLKVYGANNLKKVFGLGPKYLSTNYSLSRTSVPKWTSAQDFNSVTSGSSEMGPGTTRLNLRCGIHAPRGRFIKVAAYADRWGMRVIPSHFSTGANDESAISEEGIEDIEEMDEEGMEELFALEETKGEDVEVEEIAEEIAEEIEK